MPKPYSDDLRERLVASVEGGLSRHQAAARFRVAQSTAVNWVRRSQQTGSVKPGQMGGHRPRTIGGEHAAWLVERVRARDFTLRGLVTELAARGLKADYWDVRTLVHEQRLTYKKRHWSQPSKPAPISPAVENNG